MSPQQQPRRRHGWGFEESPFPDNDPFLPARNSKPELCQGCGKVHRRDLGCPRPLQVPPWLATVFGILFVVVLAALWSRAVMS